MQPTLELSMIVKNAATGLDRCLRSVAGVVDRITVGDTGSSDGTRAIASGHGAEILVSRWQDDFAEARNQVLAQAKCDWVLILDADEMLDNAARAALPALLQNQAVWAYDVWRWNYVEDRGYRSAGEQAVVNPGVVEQARRYPAYFPTDHTRLFRRDPRIRFEHCVHESVVDSLEAAHLERRRANFVIHHFGYVEDGALWRSKKDDLYYRLSLKKLAAAPKSYEAHLEAGIAELDHAKQAAPALEHFTAALSIDPSRHVGWLYRGICLTRLGRHAEALRDLEKAASLNSSTSLVHSAFGDVHFQTGSYAEACAAYVCARQLGDTSELSFAKLGAAEVQLGMRREGLLKVQAAVEQCPASGELLDILATTALLAGEPSLACDAAERRISIEGATGFHFLLAASIHKHAGKLAQAEMILDRARTLFPDDAEIVTMTAT